MCERDVYVESLVELHRPGLVAKLNKTMDGTQDASNAWQKLWGEHLFFVRASKTGSDAGICGRRDGILTKQ